MGTNYYVKTTDSPFSGSVEGEKHIGKTSYGWPFIFRAYPEEGLKDWTSWKAYLEGKTIVDESGYSIPITTFEQLVLAHRTDLNIAFAKKNGWMEWTPDGDRVSEREFS